MNTEWWFDLNAHKSTISDCHCDLRTNPTFNKPTKFDCMKYVEHSTNIFVIDILMTNYHPAGQITSGVCMCSYMFVLIKVVRTEQQTTTANVSTKQITHPHQSFSLTKHKRRQQNLMQASQQAPIWLRTQTVTGPPTNKAVYESSFPSYQNFDITTLRINHPPGAHRPHQYQRGHV